MSKRISEAELADCISEWQAIIERARGPALMAEAQFGLRLTPRAVGLGNAIGSRR